MDFGALAGKVGGTAKEAARNGLINGLLDISGNTAMSGQVRYAEYEYDANGHIKGINSKYASNVVDSYESLGSSEMKDVSIDGNYGGLTSGTERTVKQKFLKDYPTKYSASDNYLLSNSKESDSKKETEKPSKYGMLYNDVATKNLTDYNILDNQNKINENPISDIFSIKIPDWSYADFINERAIWQKGLSSIFDEPGWFYFKIFFDFDTDHGLFGGLLNSKYLTNATNSAAKYLYSIRNLHRYIKPQDRINSLYKFTSILSYINTNAPWYFKSINGLDKVNVPILDEFSKERSIEIGVTQDAIDMRLSTLMSLYYYACYDNMTKREIIPANLRKFNMSVILFQAPLRYLHTSYTSNQKMEFMGVDIGSLDNELAGLVNKANKTKYPKSLYKTMNTDHGSTGSYQNVMSMKVYTFKGCEFDRETFANIIPQSMSNEAPFQIGNSSIKITYSSVTEHTMNEFFAMMFGSDGFYFNQYSNYQLATSEGKNWNGYVNRNETGWNEQLDRYKSLYDTFEDIARGGTILGLVDKPKTYKKAIDATEAIMNGLFDNPGLLKGLATNFALGLLGSSKDSRAPQGNLYGDYGIGSAYYKDKLEMLKNGVHERTTAPYYYDPVTGVRVDLHKNRTYSAYNYKNDVSDIKNFNVTNWLDTQTQKAASYINDNIRTLINNNSNFTQQPYIPNQYNNETAQEIDVKKFEGKGKSHDMVDDPNTWDRVQKPYTYEQTEVKENNTWNYTQKPYTYEQAEVKENNTWNYTQKPYTYDPSTIVTDKQNLQKQNSEEWKNTEKPYIYDNKDMVDDPNTWDNVQQPFTYDPKDAIDYENSKAGGPNKNQSMVDDPNTWTYTKKPY